MKFSNHKIATLGPIHSFSEHAARIYCQQREEEKEVVLFSTMQKAFAAIGESCDFGILPMENMIEGYVQPMLDLMIHSNLVIVDEFKLPIHFSFVANCGSVNEIRRMYVQFVTQGQCTAFIEKTIEASGDRIELITTPSNGLSVEKVVFGERDCSAIVPSFILKKYQFKLMRQNVHDVEGNETRFILLGKEGAHPKSRKNCKTSIVIIEGADHPGMLADALSAFSKRDINLLSIISRPTKKLLGKYYFFIDFEGHFEQPAVGEALAEISLENEIKILGSYPMATGQ